MSKTFGQYLREKNLNAVKRFAARSITVMGYGYPDQAIALNGWYFGCFVCFVSFGIWDLGIGLWLYYFEKLLSLICLIAHAL